MQQTVDFSSVLTSVFSALLQWLRDIFTSLDSIYIFHGVSLLNLIIAAVVVGLIISAVFVLFDGGDADD